MFQSILVFVGIRFYTKAKAQVKDLELFHEYLKNKEDFKEYTKHVKEIKDVFSNINL